MNLVSHIPVIFFVIGLSFLVLVGAISWVAWNRHDDGMRGLAGMITCSSLSYVILSLYGTIPDLITLGGFYILTGLSNLFLQYGVMKFFRRRMPWHLFLLPVVAIAVVVVHFSGNIVMQTQFCDAIYILQLVVICATILHKKLDFPSCGCNMLLAGIIMAVLVTLWWLMLTARTPDLIYGAHSDSSYQLQLYFASYVLMLLETNGFILMSKEAAQAELQNNLRRDKLTGLSKSRWIEEAARSNLIRLKQFALPVTLVLIDIDHFKQVNARCGYASGNRILQQLSELLQQQVTSTNEIYRMKGGSFALLLPSLNIYRVVQAADDLLATVRDFHFDGDCRISVSCGISVANATDSWTSWLFRAQHALQKAKTYGENQIQVEEIDFTTDNLPNGIARMGELRWHPSYNTGNEQVDAQHRKLFERTNILLHLWVRSDNKETISGAVSNMLAFTKTHLDYESSLLSQVTTKPMTDISDRHVSQHEEMLKRAEHLLRRYQQNKLTTDALFNYIIFELVIGHVSTADSEIAPLLRTVS